MSDDADTADDDAAIVLNLFSRFNADETLKAKDASHRKAQESHLLNLLPVADALQDLKAHLGARGNRRPKPPLLPFSKARIRNRRALEHLVASRRRGDADLVADLRRRTDVVLRILLRALKSQGVEPMHSAGNPFDLARHCAIGVRAVDGLPDDVVVEETERGYIWNDAVLRQAQVIVSQATATRPKTSK